MRYLLIALCASQLGCAGVNCPPKTLANCPVQSLKCTDVLDSDNDILCRCPYGTRYYLHIKPKVGTIANAN